MNKISIQPAKSHAVFLINLLQDVNILRPLIYMARQDLDLPTLILISGKFIKRDKSKTWKNEIAQISDETACITATYSSTFEALEWLSNRRGIIFAGSESNLPAHDMTNEVFKAASSAFLKVTLQHGYECIGFLQSEQHNLAHGHQVGFGADIVCGWFPLDQMRSICGSETHKLVVTGPTSLLQSPSEQFDRDTDSILKSGLICENLHSSRMNISGDLKVDFIDQFSAFCKALANNKERVTLRPHPGGQYVIKHKLKVANNVDINNDPMYKIDLSSFAYGISAPSSVVIDMVLAGIPVAVWRDSDGIMDSDNYSGLTEVYSLEDWIFFAQDAKQNPEKYLARQERFLQKIKLIRDQSMIYDNYVSVFRSALHLEQQYSPTSPVPNSAERILFVSNGLIPTLQLSFLKPLSNLSKGDDVELFCITEEQLNDYTSDHDKHIHLMREAEQFKPTVIIFCRYSGPFSASLRIWAKQAKIPTIYHIDDDLLSIPPNIGMAKYKHHNSLPRMSSVKYLLDNVDLVYCSTEKLKERLDSLNVNATTKAGSIYCSSRVMIPAKNRPVKKIGYMASADHSHNLTVVLPAIIKILRKHKHITFEFFGSIPIPKELKEFGSRISTAPPIKDYSLFLEGFSEREWDIGICPLAPIDFNLMKANTKWVEYTTVGIAVVASTNTVYDSCCSDDCGLLASTEEEWFEHLDNMIVDQDYKYNILMNAQKKLTSDYSIDRLKKQVFDMIEQARELSV